MSKIEPIPEILVLAGGFGTRLRHVVTDVPKALAPVGGRPFLHYLVDNWFRQGARSLTFLLYHQARLIKDFLAAAESRGDWPGCEIHTLTEPEPLGTGGAVSFAVRQRGLRNAFLVANADTWLGSGTQAIAEAGAPAIATVHVPNTERYGSVQAERRHVTAFAEKRASSGAGWINAGLYLLHPDHFAHWDGRAFSLEGELFPVLVDSGKLSAVPLETDFIDIGIPDDYFRFCRWIEADRKGALCN